MSSFEAVGATQAYRERCEDRIAVFNHETHPSWWSQMVLVVPGGRHCCPAVIREIEAVVLEYSLCERVGHAFCVKSIAALATEKRPQSLSTFAPLESRGSSVGDSRAVVVKDGTITELTANQKRKP